MKSWRWVGFYGIGVIVAWQLGTHLGNLQIFKERTFGDTQLPVSNLVKFIGHGAALLLFLLLGYLTAVRIPEDGKRLSFLRRIILPATLFIVVLAGHKVLWLLVGPSVVEIDRTTYNSIFVLAALSAALWLTLAWMRNSALLTQSTRGQVSQSRPANLQQESARLQPEPAPSRKPSAEPNRTVPLRAQPSNLPKESQERTVRVEPPGQRRKLGRYAVIKELGRGAMGVVYLGKDPTIQRFVALKTVRFDEVDEPGQLPDIKRRFFREAESTGRLSHPNIVTIFDAGEEEGLGYIAMEVLDGITLKDWCGKEHLQPVKHVLELIAKVAEALDHAHSQGVVHRDIKPANIMITKGGIVKITDFGIARLTTTTKTQTNVILGTPSYMSPEQVAGEKVDGRSDLFSLGVVLYELLTGERPFQGESIASLIYQIANKPHRSPAQLRNDLPPCCVSIIERALCKETGERYQRGLEFAVDLRVCLQTLPN